MWRGFRRVEDPSSHGGHNPEGWPITGSPPSPWTNGRHRCPIAPVRLSITHQPLQPTWVSLPRCFSRCNVWSAVWALSRKSLCVDPSCRVFSFNFNVVGINVVLCVPFVFNFSSDVANLALCWISHPGSPCLIFLVPWDSDVVVTLHWSQHYSAGRSDLGATSAVQVSGGQIPPSAKSRQHIISLLQAVLRPPCILHLLAQEIHRQMTPQDLSSQVPSSRKLSPSTSELLFATSPRKNFKTWCPQSSLEQKRSLLGLCVILDESIEEKGEEDVLRVPCIAWDIAQEMEWRFCEKHNLNLSHAWACNIMCDVRIDCAHLYRLNCGVWEVYLFTLLIVDCQGIGSFRQAKNNYLKKKKDCRNHFCNRFSYACIGLSTYFSVQSRLKIANNPNYDSTSHRCAAPGARMKTNLLKDNISIQFEGWTL